MKAPQFYLLYNASPPLNSLTTGRLSSCPCWYFQTSCFMKSSISLMLRNLRHAQEYVSFWKSFLLHIFLLLSILPSTMVTEWVLTKTTAKFSWCRDACMTSSPPRMFIAAFSMQRITIWKLYRFFFSHLSAPIFWLFIYPASVVHYQHPVLQPSAMTSEHLDVKSSLTPLVQIPFPTTSHYFQNPPMRPLANWNLSHQNATISSLHPLFLSLCPPLLESCNS